jgi:hypothetical protein
VKPRRLLDTKNLDNVFLPTEEQASTLWKNFMSSKTSYERNLQDQMSVHEKNITNIIIKAFPDFEVLPQQMICYQYNLDLKREITRFVQPDILMVNHDQTVCYILEIKRNSDFDDEIQCYNTIDLVSRIYKNYQIEYVYVYIEEFDKNIDTTELRNLILYPKD